MGITENEAFNSFKDIFKNYVTSENTRDLVGGKTYSNYNNLVNDIDKLKIEITKQEKLIDGFTTEKAKEEPNKKLAKLKVDLDKKNTELKEIVKKVITNLETKSMTPDMFRGGSTKKQIIGGANKTRKLRRTNVKD